MSPLKQWLDWAVAGLAELCPTRTTQAQSWFKLPHVQLCL